MPVRGAATMSARCPLPERGHEVEHAGGEGLGRGLQLDPVLRVERGQVVEEDLLLRPVGRLEVDRVDLDEREVALVLLGRADLAADGVAGAQVELADLRGRDVDVVGPGQVAVLGGAQEAEAVGQDLEHALGEDQPFLLRLRAQDLEDQLLLLHGGGARDLERLGHLGQLGDAHLLERGQVQPVSLGRGRGLGCAGGRPAPVGRRLDGHRRGHRWRLGFHLGGRDGGFRHRALSRAHPVSRPFLALTRPRRGGLLALGVSEGPSSLAMSFLGGGPEWRERAPAALKLTG